MSRRRLRAELAVPTTRQEDMRHPSHVWADPEFAKEPLDKLVNEYLHHLDGRSQPISPDTREKYRKSLLALLRWHPGVRRAPWLRSVSRFVVLYYTLWASADAILLATGSDLGFALRVVPNVLYYGGLIGVIGAAGAAASHAASAGEERG